MATSTESHPKELNIQQTFSGKCVLITGATGFVGKVLLEKLIRSCPGISQILVLIRTNSELTSAERLQKLFENNVFDKIKLKCPEALGKVRELDGDVTEENLQLQKEDLQRVISEVNFVFHCAASVRFENDPRSTLRINFLGVKNVLNVCKQMNKLMAIVHVSTAYSFCNQENIEEKIYEEHIYLDQLEEIIMWMNADQIKGLFSSINHERPSMYQYSKALGEVCIQTNFNKLPIAIVRPSIITAAAKEPFPETEKLITSNAINVTRGILAYESNPKKGWIDNYNGPSGFIALNSKGILKTLLVRPGVKADWVPVDIVVNTLILAAHHIVQKGGYPSASDSLSIQSNIPVINCVCPRVNSITWSEIIDICIPLLYKYPSIEIYGFPGGTVTSSPTRYGMYKYLYHYLPAAIMDLALVLIWKKRRFVKQYKSIHKVLDFLQLYTMNNFDFTYSNMIHLSESYPNDKALFFIDQSTINWRQYLEDYVRGVRRFYLKEKDATLSQARKKLFWLQCLSICGKLIPVSIIVMLLMKKQRMKISFPAQFVRNIFKGSYGSLRVSFRKW